jgi:hypothetical protein
LGRNFLRVFLMGTNRLPGGVITGSFGGDGAPPTLEYLVVAGGGGGGGGLAGGGGAGGLVTNAGYVITPGTTYTITIGNGGIAGVDLGDGGNGANSIFGIGTVTTLSATSGTITAVGGGKGGAGTGGVGGSAGGSGRSTNSPAGIDPNVVGQGNPSGIKVADDGTGAGGGGAGSAGQAARPYLYGGNGGAGLISTITGFPVVYAGGGGGGVRNDGGSSGRAGAGSEAAGAGSAGGYRRDRTYNVINQVGTGGAPNTGSAGAGGCATSPYLEGHGPGGSGIVVIRYLAYYSPAKSTTGSPNTYVIGPWRVYKFIQSGTISF